MGYFSSMPITIFLLQDTYKDNSMLELRRLKSKEGTETIISSGSFMAVLKEMCDRKNSVLFTETKCLILSPDFKLPDESQVMLKIPRKDNICDNGTKFKNYEMNQFCGIKGIKKEFSNARTPQQNGVAERKNKTLIEAARNSLQIIINYTILDEAVNTACLCTKQGCPVTILNTLDHLGQVRMANADVRISIYRSLYDSSPKEDAERTMSLRSSKSKIFTLVNAATPSNANYTIDPLMPDLEDTANLKIPVETKEGNSSTDDKIGSQAMSRRASPVQATKTLDTGGFTSCKQANLPGFVDPKFSQIECTQARRRHSNDVFIMLLQAMIKKTFLLLVQDVMYDDIFLPTKKSLSTELEQLMHKIFQMSSMGELTFFLGLLVDILKKFGFSSVKTATTPMETHKPLSKDTDRIDVDVHLYRSMIRSLMYLTSSRPNIMFAVCACSRFQVQPKASHMLTVKRIFRYLKGASLDRKSTIGGCQFLGCRLISWQCKKQTIVANSTTKAEYIVASNCCRQVLWLQNQLLDYGYNFMHTKIHVDNEIEIRHHFIRDSYELIEMVKIHTDYNVADLLSKDFDVTRYRGLYTNECWLYTTQQMVINSLCLIDKKELAILGQTAT
ncbi:putative ribonuclease H-like domain-containing protein, partial [Tanacetum coccineum]